ncbi:MAG: sugar phosphate isomerase/epimerase family protein [Bacteroidales bacterium]
METISLKIRKYLVFSLMIFFTMSCNTDGSGPDRDIFSADNLVAWCIVPFDASERSPEERAAMLNDLGFKKMAWDWRMEHIDDLPREIEALGEYGIELSAIWLWIDGSARHGLLPHHEQIIDYVNDAGLKTTYWVSFSDDFFDFHGDEEKVNEGVRVLGMVHDRIRQHGCKIALYNHMGWFGEPENQVRIIENLGRDSIGIVYNFHHAHHQIDNFAGNLEVMMPWLYTVNINGMRADGPRILDVGKGDMERDMIKTLIASGFDGTVGILGHTEGEDIKIVLERNLNGLKYLLEEM